jgi:putative DNA primase/helicase
VGYVNPPFSIDDICTKKTRADGSTFYEFARTKAAKAICDKMQLALEVFDSREDKPEIWYYADGYYHSGGAKLIGYFLDEMAQDLSDSENINDVLRRIRGKLRLKPVEFDITDPFLVGCRDGITLDLQTGKSRKAAPMDLISMPIPVKYDPSAKCPEFIKFLNSITATDDDRLGIIDFLASLLIAAPMDFFVAAPGLGSNGRSKLKDFIRAFVGSDACRSIPLKDLGNRFTSGFLTRCRVNFCNETEINGIILEFIKRSSEKMPVEQKFKGMVNMLLYLKYFFDTNTMPAISDTSYGAERRLCRWDMPWRFVDSPDTNSPMEKQRDPDIINRITTDEELSGVLNMVLERAPEVIKQRMIHRRAGGLQEYALQSRSGDIFIELFLTPTNNNDNKVHIDTIRKEYQRYCTVTNSNLLGSSH